MAQTTFRVNGVLRRVDAAGLRLIEVLREGLDLTGTKNGCGEGQCGACTVLVDGKAVASCQVMAESVGGKAITTIEGLASGGKLHPLQEAFLEKEAFQCGFCTPGMILGAVALLREKPKASEAEIRAGLEGHVCRCGVYGRIVEAVKVVSRG